jgi:hypothetical protein
VSGCGLSTNYDAVMGRVQVERYLATDRHAFEGVALQIEVTEVIAAIASEPVNARGRDESIEVSGQGPGVEEPACCALTDLEPTVTRGLVGHGPRRDHSTQVVSHVRGRYWRYEATATFGSSPGYRYQAGSLHRGTVRLPASAATPSPLITFCRPTAPSILP